MGSCCNTNVSVSLLQQTPSSTISEAVQTTSKYWMASTNTPGRGVQRPTETMACSSSQYSTGTSFHLSYRHKKRELSTDAQALRISGKRPQKATVWQALYRSKIIAGMSFSVGVVNRRGVGHYTQLKKLFTRLFSFALKKTSKYKQETTYVWRRRGILRLPDAVGQDIIQITGTRLIPDDISTMFPR